MDGEGGGGGGGSGVVVVVVVDGVEYCESGDKARRPAERTEYSISDQQTNNRADE